MEQERQIEGQMDVEEVIALSEAEDGINVRVTRARPDSRRKESKTEPMTKAERARRVVADRLRGEDR